VEKGQINKIIKTGKEAILINKMKKERKKKNSHLVALSYHHLMIDTPWFLGPIVPCCGMPGENVHLRNCPVV